MHPKKKEVLAVIPLEHTIELPQNHYWNQKSGSEQ